MLMGDVLLVADAELVLYRDFFMAAESDQFFQELLTTTRWQQRRTRFGTSVPRMTAYHGDAGTTYAYSGIVEQPRPWAPALLAIRHRIEAVAETPFNSVLLNLYRDERDSVAWHSDDEEELGSNPVIASISFGAERLFRFRHKARLRPNVDLSLPHGSLLLMRGETQRHWQHSIAKTKQPQGPRLNLTYRFITS